MTRTGQVRIGGTSKGHSQLWASQPPPRERESLHGEMLSCRVEGLEDWTGGGGYKRASQPHMSPDFVFFFFSCCCNIFPTIVGWDESERSGRAGRFYKCGWWHCTGVYVTAVSHTMISKKRGSQKNKNKFKVNHFQAQEEEEEKAKPKMKSIFFFRVRSTWSSGLSCVCEGREQG